MTVGSSSGWSRNASGVKDGADCYRTIGGVRWSWYAEDAEVFNVGEVGLGGVSWYAAMVAAASRLGRETCAAAVEIILMRL